MIDMSDERVTVDQLVTIAVMPADNAVLDAIVASAKGNPQLTDHEHTSVAVRATVQYLVENGLVTPCAYNEVPDLLPTRVGQGPASLSGDLRALLDLDTGERQVNEEEEL